MKRLHRFDVLINWFEEHLTINNYRPRTISDYLFELSLFRRWLENQNEIEDIDDLKKEHLRDYTAELYQRALAITTIGHKLAILKSFFKSLYNENKLYCDLFSTILLPRLGRYLPKDILSENEIIQLFDYLEKRTDFTTVKTFSNAVWLRDRAMIEVLYSCGLRRAELLNLKCDDLDCDQHLIYVRDGKGGKDRVVPIGKSAFKSVVRYLKEGWSFMLHDSGNSFLFSSHRSYRYSASGLCKVIKRIGREACVKKNITIHGFRHSCATHMLNAGADIRYVQELLGHGSLTATQIYTHVSIEKLKQTHEDFHPREQ